MSSADSPASAFAELTAKGGDTTWILCGWDKKSNALTLLGKGKGDLAELKSQLNDNTVQFAVYKVQGVDETDSGVTSVRDKLVTITFVGKSVPPLQRNFVIASKDARSSLFQGTAVDQQADDVDSLTEKAIAKELLRCGGAHKPTHYQFGPSKINLTEL